MSTTTKTLADLEEDVKALFIAVILQFIIVVLLSVRVMLWTQ